MFGFFLDLHSGLVIGFIVSIIIFLVLAFWGEKFVLYFAKARYMTDDEQLLNRVKNFSCHLNLYHVGVYTSSIFPNNVYYSRSYFGQPVLILGTNIIKSFSRLELNSLIYASLLRLKSIDSRNRTMVSLILLIFVAPIYLLKRLFSKEKEKEIYLNTLLYPGFLLKSFMYSSLEMSLELDQSVSQVEGLRKDYLSAIFKLSKLHTFSLSHVGSFLLYELAHVPNTENDVLFNLVLGEDNTQLRLESLSGY